MISKRMRKNKKKIQLFVSSQKTKKKAHPNLFQKEKRSFRIYQQKNFHVLLNYLGKTEKKN